MPLTTSQRNAVGREYMRDRLCPGPITKPDLVAAIAAADDWMDANTTSFNNALPVAFRTNTTTAQQIELFLYVFLARVGRIL